MLTSCMRKLANGTWPLRIRYGQDRSARLQLPAHLTSPQAEARAERLGELAKLLWRVPEGNARRILTAAVEADADVFAKIEAIAREEAAKHAPRPKQQATFREIGEAWTSGKLAKDYPDHVKAKRSVAADVSRLTHLYKTIGDVPLAEFTLAHYERAMGALPESARSSSTRRQYGQVIARILRMAVYPLKLLERSPLPEGLLPNKGQRPAYAFLYPDEDAQLLACKEVPVRMRLLYGFLAREGMRVSEALGLRWSDFDLTRGRVALDQNKTDEPREWQLSAGVAEALAAFRLDAPDGARVFPQIDLPTAAKRFREHLKAAGVKRPKLFERSDARRPIRLHDLRASFITVAQECGHNEKWVRKRTGHTTSAMLTKYERSDSDPQLGNWLPLSEALGVRHEVRQPASLIPENLAISVGHEGLEPSTNGLRIPAEPDSKEQNSAFPAAADAPTDATGAPKDTLAHPPEASPAPRGAPSELDAALAEALRAATAAGAWAAVAELARAIERRSG
jgi:integrase